MKEKEKLLIVITLFEAPGLPCDFMTPELKRRISLVERPEVVSRDRRASRTNDEPLRIPTPEHNESVKLPD